MLVFVLLSGCGTSGALLKEQEVVIVEKIIKAATYHPERPPEIRPAPTTKGEDFFKAVNVQVVGAAFLGKLAEVYPPGYFEDEDIAILLDAAVAWMGEEIPDAFFCMGDPQKWFTGLRAPLKIFVIAVVLIIVAAVVQAALGL